MSEAIVINADVLSSNYLPERLLHRENELQQVKNNIENRINTLIVGPVGSGKTTLVKRVIKDVNAEDIRYIDCTLYDTSFSVLKEILPSARLILQRSIYELIKRLAEEMRRKRLWICFDNFVRLKEIDIVGKVMSLGANVVLVSNVERDAEVLNQNVLSNIPSIIKLPNYSIEQSIDILRERATEALIKSSFTDELLAEVSERARGNMKLAINLLRAAAYKAQSEERERIGNADLPETLYALDNPGNLKRDERTILEILEEKKRLSSGELFDLYRQQTCPAKGERSFRNYMENLCSKGFVKATGVNRWRTYELVRPVREAELELSDGEFHEA